MVAAPVLFLVIFGLSMDYHLFILSRVKELAMTQIGVGLAAATLTDATLIWGVLLPATMKLLATRTGR